MKHRMLRVNEVVKRELSGIIAREMSFEGALVSINHVDVTPDLKNAHVFVSVLGTEARESVMSKLASHRPALQTPLPAVARRSPRMVRKLNLHGSAMFPTAARRSR